MKDFDYWLEKTASEGKPFSNDTESDVEEPTDEEIKKLKEMEYVK